MAGGFDSLGLLPELLRGVDEMGWLLPTDVQDEAIPSILGGRDVMVASPTGSGKTAAFTLPIVQLIHEKLNEDSRDSDSPDESKKEEEGEEDSDQDAGGSVSHTEVTFSPSDRDALFLLDPQHGNSRAQTSGPRWFGGRATHGLASKGGEGGRWVFEVSFAKNGKSEGIGRVGLSTQGGTYDLGKDRNSWGFGGTAKKCHGSSFTDYGSTYGDGDVVSCCVDMDRGEVFFAKNGRLFELAFNNLFPVSDKGRRARITLFPSVCMKDMSCSINFGPSLQFPIDGFSPYSACPDLILQSSSSSSSFSGPLALIIEPSRDLAEQVYNQIMSLAAHVTSPAIQPVLVVGGDGSVKGGYDKAIRGCQIVVGTPGKVCELTRKGTLDLSHVLFFVLDEADRFLEEDNREDITFLYSSLGHSLESNRTKQLQVCFFSATLHSEGIQSLSNQLCHNPIWVDLKGKDAVPETVHHVAYTFDPTTWRPEDLAILNPITGQVMPFLMEPSDVVALIQTDNVHTEFPATLELDSDPQEGSNKGKSKKNKKKKTKRKRQQEQEEEEGDDNQDQTRTTTEPSSSSSSHPNVEAMKASYRIKLIKFLMVKLIIDNFDMPQCLLFCRTNLDCSNLERFLLACGQNQSSSTSGRFSGTRESGMENPYSCCVLAGMRSLEERRRNLQAFKEGSVRFLICTDLAARGIDISGLPFVINVTLPDEAENYIHRIGRVGRAETMGLAISIVAMSSSSGKGDEIRERVWYHTCNKKGGKGCQRRGLVEEGGCTIWYNESELYHAIERRLGPDFPVLPLHPMTLSLPREFLLNEDNEEQKEGGIGRILGYGLSAAEASREAEFSSHLLIVNESVRKLASLQVDAQTLYYAMKTDHSF